MARIGSAIPVPKPIVGAYRIVIRSLGRSRDGERRLHQGGFEDPLRANDRHTSLIKFKPLDKDRMRNNLSMCRGLSSKPIKGRSSNPRIVIPVEVHETVSTGTQF